MKLVTAQQMRMLDQAAIQGGIPSLDLMERAGAGLARAVQRVVSSPATVGVLLGSGNNAGDGLVAARYLSEQGYTLQLFLTKPFDAMSPDSQINWNRLQTAPAEVVFLHGEDADFSCCACLIDALLGTGLSKAVRGPLASIIERANASGKPIIAADIPSGLSADTGEPLGMALRATQTVTFGLAKIGLVLPRASDYVGQIEVVDIGLPRALIAALKTPYHMNGPDCFMAHWPTRTQETHKGNYGHGLVIAGSTGMIGAGFLASRAALRTGSGLVTYALPKTAYEKFPVDATEVMVVPLEDAGTGCLSPEAWSAYDALLAKKSAVAIGPGLGQAPPTCETVRALITKIPLAMVIDADALHALDGHVELLAERQAATIMTPHPGEMARMTGVTTAEVQADRTGIAVDVAVRLDVTVVLKGHRTIIASPEGQILINPTGNAGMATAGAGDVLTGIILGFVTQGMPATEAAAAGVYLHGLAGDLAATSKGAASMIASDIIEMLPQAMQMVTMAL